MMSEIQPLLISTTAACLLVGAAYYALMMRSEQMKEWFLRWWLRLVALFQNAGYVYTDESIRFIVIGGLSVSMLCGAFVSLVFAVIVPVCSAFAGLMWLKYSARRYRNREVRINDDVCFALARHLRAGATLEHAVLEVNHQFAQTSILSMLNRDMIHGLTVSESLQKNLSTQSLSSSEKMLCATMHFYSQVGGSSAHIFERIGEYFHRSYGVAEDTHASLAQVRMSGYVIGLLPLAMFVLSFMSDQRSAMFLFTQPMGIVCLVCGCFLEVLGIVWMKKLIAMGVQSWA